MVYTEGGIGTFDINVVTMANGASGINVSSAAVEGFEKKKTFHEIVGGSGSMKSRKNKL